ncbi:MAG: spondin domain-containing protein [Burkholderiaceae bacterium]
MLSPIKSFAIAAAAALGNACGGGGSPTPDVTSATVPMAPASAAYRVTFQTNWTQSTFPTQFPPNRHFSGLVGATHKDGVSLWDEGKLASLGIQNMAEFGDKTALLADVNRAIQVGQVQYALSGGGIGIADSRVMLEFEVTQNYPRVSLVSMVAPSPSWFVGVSQLPLFDKQQWVDEVTIPLEVYDAGTDSGLSFASPDSARNPHIPIDLLSSAAADTDFNRGLHRSSAAYIGTFSFKRIK